LLWLMPKLFITHHIFVSRCFITPCRIWFAYHGYNKIVIWHEIFWHCDGSFGLIVGSFCMFFQRSLTFF
jgi:hypothetical protein